MLFTLDKLIAKFVKQPADADGGRPVLQAVRPVSATRPQGQQCLVVMHTPSCMRLTKFWSPCRCALPFLPSMYQPAYEAKSFVQHMMQSNCPSRSLNWLQSGLSGTIALSSLCLVSCGPSHRLCALLGRLLPQLSLILAQQVLPCGVCRGNPYSDAIYIANAHVLLHDDTCYRLESLAGGDVSVQLLDPNKTEVSPCKCTSGCYSDAHWCSWPLQ